jgi:hypothetical protein
LTKGNLHEKWGRYRSRSSGADEPRDNSKRKFLIQVDFSHIGKLMGRRS